MGEIRGQADARSYEALVRLCLEGAVWTGKQWVVSFEGRILRAGENHPPWAMADALVERYPKTLSAARRHRDRLRSCLEEIDEAELIETEVEL